VIVFQGVGKTYRSLIRRQEVVALSDVTLEMRRGEVIGIAGPNGAGKSTLISLLMGFLHPTDGTVEIDGQSPRRYVEQHGVSYLTELVNLPPRWRVPEVLRRTAILSGVPSDQLKSRVDQVITELGLDEHRSKQIRQLSKGNLQRVGLGQALVGEFQVVVLDEPTHGLDPVWTARFRDVVASLRSPDRVVLIASHNLDELERLADRVAILNKGRLTKVVEHGGAVAESESVDWRITFEGEPDVVARFPHAVAIEGREGSWRVSAQRAELSTALGAMLVDGAVLVECLPETSRLESAFREATQ
jgi:ABC-2 type transport system ATP-binding protein